MERRRRKEKIFRGLGITAISLSLVVLFFMLFQLVFTGFSAFFQTEIYIENRSGLSHQALVSDLKDQLGLSKLTEEENYLLGQLISRKMMSQDSWVLASSDVNLYMKDPDSFPKERLDPLQHQWIESLRSQEKIRVVWSWPFLKANDSREPEAAGLGGALMGSFYVLLIAMGFAFPVGVLSAVYLEEIAKKSLWADVLEVNISNLAAVPSIIYGLLGLAIFINIFDLPRPSALVGGLTIGLMVLPTMIVSSRLAIRSVPQSIRDAARGLGASSVQIIFHHVLPCSMPGILTGAIMAVARALGESAPLLMIGMVAFVGNCPSNVYDPATVLPVQIFSWARSPELGFVEKTSGAILILLIFLILINSFAIILRKRMEKRW